MATMTGAMRALEADGLGYSQDELVQQWDGYLEARDAGRNQDTRDMPRIQDLGDEFIEKPTHTTMGHKLLEADFPVIARPKKSWWHKVREFFTFRGTGRHTRARRHAELEWNSV
jgi:hypothetical protein